MMPASKTVARRNGNSGSLALDDQKGGAVCDAELDLANDSSVAEAATRSPIRKRYELATVPAALDADGSADG